MSTSYELDEVDAFVVDAVGLPGARTFFFRARADEELLTFKCEKVQAQALAEAIRSLMGDLPPTEATPAALPALDDAVDAEWVVGSIGLGYEAATDRVVVILEEMDDSFVDESDMDPDEIPFSFPETDDDDLESDVGTARVALTRGQALAFAELAERLVRAGRPSCPLCATPISGNSR